MTTDRISMKIIFILLAIMAIFAYVAPLFILGENAYFRIGDNLDSNVVWYKLIIDNNMIFASSSDTVPTIMGGLPRISFPSEFDFLLWLNVWFGPVYGYAINQLIMRIVAFFGMYFLVKKYLLPHNYKIDKNIIETISIGSALCFSFLPFWPSGGLSVAGLPLVTYLLLEIKNNNDTWYKWLALLLIPFYSSFVLVYFFYLFLAGIYWLLISIKDRTFHIKLFLALFLFTTIHLFTNYRLLFELFSHTFVSHRSEMSIAKAMGYNMHSFSDLLKNSLSFLINGYHAHIATFQKFILLPSLFIALSILSIKHDYFLLKRISLVLFAIIIFSFIAKLWYYPPFDSFKDVFPFFKQFNMSRIAWLLPLIWYLAFALSLFTFANYIKFKYINIIILILILLQAIYLFSKSDFFLIKKQHQPTFEQFYDVKLFDKIKKELKINKNISIATIGMYPAILQYNGLKTIGGYSANYPLKYKHEFRKIISNVLDNNENLKRKFDYWGSYCYIRVSDISKNFFGNKPNNIEIDISELNISQMKNMGVKYIFSAYKIKNNENIKFVNLFTSTNNFWKVYIYKIK